MSTYTFPVLGMMKKACHIEGCVRTGKITRSMCPMHYQRWLKYGDPQTVLKPGPQSGWWQSQQEWALVHPPEEGEDHA